MRFSVIVPFYNTNIQCFDRTIDSLSKQTYKEFETIIVDDGSNESVAKALEGLNYRNLAVKVIHQVNKGLPGARNTGIKNATGEYVVFVDSDDILPQNMLSEARDYISEYNNPDIIFGRMVYYKDNNGQVMRITRENCDKIDLDSYLMSQRQNFKDTRFYIGKEIEKVKIKILHQDDSSIILGSSSANVYKRSLVVNCLFDENVRICEDQIFNRNILDYISTCLVVPNEWYGYVQYKSSMLHDQTKNVDLEKTFSYWDKIAQVDERESNVIKHYSNIHNIGLMCDEVKKMAMSGKRYEECELAIKKLYNHIIVRNAIVDTDLYKASINKVKLFLFVHKYTKLLFYMYAIKGNV